MECHRTPWGLRVYRDKLVDILCRATIAIAQVTKVSTAHG